MRRCQAMTVLGLTNTKAFRQPEQGLDSHAQSNRSATLVRGREGHRWNTASWWQAFIAENSICLKGLSCKELTGLDWDCPPARTRTWTGIRHRHGECGCTPHRRA